jgi:hypothetical protein
MPRIVRHGITALVGALDLFEGKFLLRSSDLLSTDRASAMLFVAEAEKALPAALT